MYFGGASKKAQSCILYAAAAMVALVCTIPRMYVRVFLCVFVFVCMYMCSHEWRAVCVGEYVCA
jgi:hypothetical protein